MGQRKKKEKKSNLTVAFIFVAFVVSLLVVSFFIKLGILIKESRFDGEHRFTVAISSDKEQRSQDKPIQILSFSPKDSSVSKLFFAQGIPLSYTQRFLEVPIDATITLSEGSVASDRELDDVLKSMLVGYKDAKTNLTILDVIRLWWLGRNISSHSQTSQDFDPSPDLPKDIQLDKISQNIFSDEKIASEKLSVSIINGAAVPGFGNRLGRMVNNMGGNAISIKTADNDIEETTLTYFGKKSYTVTKLEEILGVRGKPGKGSDISDIIVTLGRDRANTSSF